ncbi:enoyl-CoA hydratase [Rhodococcus ruber]|uniref:crotonase/enoyl-CoA hydratase family protein n=1 Tax=Rhodococcus TaxID=1827 RepID=UPI00029B286A|nr:MULTISPECIES: crotonase/enoyl-CoA hydratase family protein [Rhodococcus]ATQ30224.1 enoyl-CoA hydratase [Rhodococcus ruber]
MSRANSSGDVRFQREGAVGIITLNRPEAMNAVDAEMSAAVGDVLTALEADPALRVGVITGAGRAFCAGADLKNLAQDGSFFAPDHPEWGFAGLTQRYVAKPLVAAVNGVALGGGAEIILACDLAVMSSEARVGLPEVKHGLIAGAGGLLRLPDQVPPKVAASMALTGEPLDAETALRWGLVNAVVPHDQVLAEALRLAAAVARNAPLAVETSKRVMAHRRNHGSDWSEPMWAMNDDALAAILASNDAAEGTRAFAESRAPIWSGN